MKPAAAGQPEYVAGTTIWFENDVPDTDREGIRAGLTAIRSYLGDSMAGPNPSDVCIDVRATSAGPVGSARTEDRTILVFTSPDGWPETPSWRVSLLIAHEYVHAWQAAAGGTQYSSCALWLIEGMADWVAARALVNAGLVPATAVLSSGSMADGPFVPDLSLLETPEGWNQTLAPYPVARQAVELLMAGQKPGTLAVYLASLAAGMTWQSAFRQVFGRSPTDFYRVFDASLTPPQTPAR